MSDVQGGKLPDLIVERADGVVRATLNRPERKNAISLAVFDALRALFDEVEASDADRALAFANIREAASYFGVHVSEDSWQDLMHHGG